MPRPRRSMTKYRVAQIPILLFVAGLWTLSACGDGGRRKCEVDSDCRSDGICADDRCARTCTVDEDCQRSGAVCQPYIDPDREDDVSICLAGDAGGGGNRCNSNADCDETQICGLNGRCLVVERRQAVRIATAPGGATSAGGAEIAAVYLLDDQDRTIGFGETVRYCRQPGIGGNPSGDTGDAGDTAGDPPDSGTTDAESPDARSPDTSSPLDASQPDGASDAERSADADVSPPDGAPDASDASVAEPADTDPTADTGPRDATDATFCTARDSIDGSEPELTADRSCTEGPKERATPLGKTGEMLVRFVSASGSPVEIREGHKIAVIEWGTNCDPDDAEGDRYDVQLCTARPDSAFDANNCRSLFGNGSYGSGKTVTTVSSI